MKEEIRYLSSSDYRDILGKLNEIKVSTYKWKEEVNADDELHIGIISEEGPEEIVTEDKKAINTADYLGFLLAAVKAQQEEIKGLKAEISRIKGVK